MARRNMPTGNAAINSLNGKVSHLIVKAQRGDFPEAPSTNILRVKKKAPADPFGRITDLNNAGLEFDAVVISFKKRRVVLKLTAVTGRPVAGFLDGILSITLEVVDAAGALLDTVEIADAPVDYIEDNT
jgi:hypothetical protein